MIWLYLDDERLPSEAFMTGCRMKDTDTIYVFKEGESLISWLFQNEPEKYSLSFDNDLGMGYTEGNIILNKIFEICATTNFKYPTFVRPHTNNPVARQRMIDATHSFKRFVNKDDIKLWNVFEMEKSSTKQYLESLNNPIIYMF